MKKALLIAAVVLLILACVGGYVILDHMFPVAEPLTYPALEDISSITLLQNSDVSTAIEISDFAGVLQNLQVNEPTRIWSIQDYPSVGDYYTIEIHTFNKQSLRRYFVYVENGQVYVESPYEGIYKANQQVLDFFAEHFKD